MSNHNPLCQQAMDIDPEVPNCICDWVDAAERDTETRIIKLLEDLACDNPFCKTFGLMPSHTGCRAVKQHIALIKGKTE